jgi:hypothetical protein
VASHATSATTHLPQARATSSASGCIDARRRRTSTAWSARGGGNAHDTMGLPAVVRANSASNASRDTVAISVEHAQR